ncbi:zinc finger protein with KRAB and SCAN domains 8 isoform 4-T5 [Molossus nigricans]
MTKVCGDGVLEKPFKDEVLRRFFSEDKAGGGNKSELFRPYMAAESRKSLVPSPPNQTPEEDLVIVKVEEDHGWDQESSQHEHNFPDQELFRLRFRKLCYQETQGPREALIQLRALCHQWLRPDLNSKEQILEMLVLEQFLSILPTELQALVKEHQLESGEEVVTLLEDLERQIDILGRPVPARAHGRRVLWEEVVHLEPAPEPPGTQLQPPATRHAAPVLRRPLDRVYVHICQWFQWCLFQIQSKETPYLLLRVPPLPRKEVLETR